MISSPADNYATPSSPSVWAMLVAALLVACGADVIGPADENDGTGATPSSGTRTSSSGGASAAKATTSRAGESTCKSGIATGSVCNPSVDVDDCIRTTRTCKCGAQGQWNCQTTTTNGQGGGTARTTARTAAASPSSCTGVTDGGDCKALGSGYVCNRTEPSGNAQVCTCERKAAAYAWRCTAG